MNSKTFAYNQSSKLVHQITQLRQSFLDKRMLLDDYHRAVLCNALKFQYNEAHSTDLLKVACCDLSVIHDLMSSSIISKIYVAKKEIPSNKLSNLASFTVNIARQSVQCRKPFEKDRINSKIVELKLSNRTGAVTMRLYR